MLSEICDLSAVQLADLLHRRELSALEALEAVLQRADAITEPLNPFTIRMDERARAAAHAADAALARGEGGPLCGIPVSTKDSHWLAGVESTCGSRARVGFVPHTTAISVERLEAAGAVNFARTTVPEFCYLGITESPVFGRTNNPWDVSRTPGGSSGGCAAAVAAGAGPLSLGGDGGGSIRIPAAFCGLVGFKPSFGLIPHEPSAPGWKTLVSVGPLARTVADARLLVEAVCGFDQRDRHSLPIGLAAAAPPPASALRVVVSEDLGFAALDGDARRAFRTVVSQLSNAGVQVVYDAPGLASSVDEWATIATAEARQSEAVECEHHATVLSMEALLFMAAGEHVTAAQYIRAQFAREKINAAYVEMFARTGASVLLTPTLGCQAFPHGKSHPDSVGAIPIAYPNLDWAPFLYDANLAGLPACAIPMGIGDAGLPLSLQVLGLRGCDAAVLDAAETIEQLIGFTSRPDLPATIASGARSHAHDHLEEA